MASGKELRAILLTHEHFDHSGGASALAMELSLPVMASKECCRVLRDGDEVLSGAGLFGSDLEPMEGVEELGPEVRLGELEMEVHPVPGHCRGQVSFVTKCGRALLCGDLAFCDGGVGRWDLPGGDLEELKGSLKRSLGWDVRSLHPGHGREEHHDPVRELELAWSSIRDL
jgi:glyoxylase-like metal-dependent hydrolase (beta-lactamase superfamily II)